MVVRAAVWAVALRRVPAEIHPLAFRAPTPVVLIRRGRLVVKEAVVAASYLAESTVNFLDLNYAYTRLELVDKNELLDAGERARQRRCR